MNHHLKTAPEGSLPALHSLQETAAAGVEAISMLISEREDLRTKNDKLETSVALLTQENEQLKRLNQTSTGERDHYMRHSIELVTRLNNIQTLINDAVREAGAAAYKKQSHPPVKLEAVPIADTEAIRSLIKRLPQNGGSGA